MKNSAYAYLFALLLFIAGVVEGHLVVWGVGAIVLVQGMILERMEEFADESGGEGDTAE